MGAGFYSWTRCLLDYCMTVMCRADDKNPATHDWVLLSMHDGVCSRVGHEDSRGNCLIYRRSQNDSACVRACVRVEHGRLSIDLYWRVSNSTLPALEARCVTLFSVFVSNFALRAPLHDRLISRVAGCVAATVTMSDWVSSFVGTSEQNRPFIRCHKWLDCHYELLRSASYIAAVSCPSALKSRCTEVYPLTAQRNTYANEE